jgi:2-polyprenyl-6-methoxyphenol hydroxylase-like FAD-dependent oxidoreductase
VAFPLPPREKPRAGLPLIVGAGPAGLTTAMMLARDRVAVRIIDKNAAPASESRALLVNHHTLDLLRETGISEKLLAVGNKVRGMKLTIAGEERARLGFDLIPHPNRFLLLVPQNVTEALLADSLREFGIVVERHTEFVAARLDPKGFGADVDLRTGGATETTRVSWLVGADGAHSAVRKALGIEFPGAAYEYDWSLVDVELGRHVEQDCVELCLARSAPFLARFPLGNGKHRIIANDPLVEELIPDEWEAGQIFWRSAFKISHRMTDRRLVGRAALIGDAAHIHSPAGGRGMNLGIEDGLTLASLIRETSVIDPTLMNKDMEEAMRARFRHWERERLARARATLAISDRLQAIGTTQSMLKLLVMPWALRLINLLPGVKREVLALLTDTRQP